MRSAPVELTVPCPQCLVDGAAVETYDPLVAACCFAIPAQLRCRLCAARWEAIVVGLPETLASLEVVSTTSCPACRADLDAAALDAHACASCGARAELREAQAALSLASSTDVADAIARWGREEGYDDADAFFQATFTLPSVDDVALALARREPIETVGDPFSPMHGGARAVRPARDVAPIIDTLPPAEAPPRALLYPLISVVAADGELHPKERELVDRFLAAEGLAPLAAEEFRVHHPADVAHFVPPERRPRIVELMCQVAIIDGLPDPNEVRVIKAYSSAWSVDEAKVDDWLAGYGDVVVSPLRQFFLKIRRFVLRDRWDKVR